MNIPNTILGQALRYQHLEAIQTGGGEDFIVRKLDGDMELVLMGVDDTRLSGDLGESCTVVLYFDGGWQPEEGFVVFDFNSVVAALGFMGAFTKSKFCLPSVHHILLS